MLSVLKTILTRLDNIEQQLNKTKGAAGLPLKQIPVKFSPQEAEKSIAALQHEAKSIIIEAKDEAFKIKREAEEEARKIRQEAISIEQRLITKEESIDKRMNLLDERERQFREKEEERNQRLTEIEKLRSELIAKLEKVAHLTREEAKSLILSAMEEKLKADIAKQIREAETTARQEAE
jgi:ribonuclease Y